MKAISEFLPLINLLPDTKTENWFAGLGTASTWEEQKIDSRLKSHKVTFTRRNGESPW